MIKERIDMLLQKKSFTDTVIPEHLLQDDLGFDSLNLVELLILLEEAFDITFDESDLDPGKLKTAADIYTLMGKYSVETKDVI